MNNLAKFSYLHTNPKDYRFLIVALFPQYFTSFRGVVTTGRHNFFENLNKDRKLARSAENLGKFHLKWVKISKDWPKMHSLPYFWGKILSGEMLIFALFSCFLQKAFAPGGASGQNIYRWKTLSNYLISVFFNSPQAVVMN